MEFRDPNLDMRLLVLDVPNPPIQHKILRHFIVEKP